MSAEKDVTDHQRVALASQVAAYRAATVEFLTVVETMTEGDLDHAPSDPAGWTPRMVVHHLADAETNAYVRLCRLLAEPAGSPIQAFDEADWALKLHYGRPVASALAVVAAVRASSAELLDLLEPVDLARTGVHTDTGTYTLADWLDVYVNHPAEHAQQVRDALGASESPS